MNLIETGKLNNVESYLDTIKKCTVIDTAKEVAFEMINAFASSEKSKAKFMKGVQSKRTIGDVVMFAYNLTLSAEGIKVV